MAMTADKIEYFVASTNEKASRIGWLFWFIITEEQTDKSITEAAFLKSGLPRQYQLSKIRPADAYRRASKSIEGRRDIRDDERIELLVRDVYHTNLEVVRNLVIEHRQVSGRKLDYDPKAATLVFDHANKRVLTELHNSEDYVLAAVRLFESNYQLFLNTHDGAAKRRAVRSVLNDLAATSLKESGGVYLIPRHNEELLFQLTTFINELPNCKSYKMPVEDTAESRDMVRDVITNKAETMLSEIRAALGSEAISELTVRQLLERSRSVRREVEIYQEVLKESIGTLEVDVELLEAQMMHLIEQL